MQRERQKKMRRAIKASVLTHDHLKAAAAHSSGRKTSKDIAMQTEWGNATREMIEAADQVALKWVTVVLPQTVQNDTAWGQWLALGTPTFPTATPGLRVGRSIRVKSIDVMFTFGAFQPPADGCPTVQCRKVWVIDRQPNGSVFGPTDVFDGLGPPNTDYTDFNAMLSAANKDRFKILSDEILSFPFRALSTHIHSKVDHFDLDFDISWPTGDTTGLLENATTNAGPYCLLFPIFTTNAPNPGGAVFAIKTTWRTTFMDA